MRGRELNVRSPGPGYWTKLVIFGRLPHDKPRTLNSGPSKAKPIDSLRSTGHPSADGIRVARHFIGSNSKCHQTILVIYCFCFSVG